MSGNNYYAQEEKHPRIQRESHKARNATASTNKKINRENQLKIAKNDLVWVILYLKNGP
jgi:hypothetical protein